MTKHYGSDTKIRAIKREIALRKTVYERRVKRGEMLQATSDNEIAIFEDILLDYLTNNFVPGAGDR